MEDVGGGGRALCWVLEEGLDCAPGGGVLGVQQLHGRRPDHNVHDRVLGVARKQRHLGDGGGTHVDAGGARLGLVCGETRHLGESGVDDAEASEGSDALRVSCVVHHNVHNALLDRSPDGCCAQDRHPLDLLGHLVVGVGAGEARHLCQHRSLVRPPEADDYVGHSRDGGEVGQGDLDGGLNREVRERGGHALNGREGRREVLKLRREVQDRGERQAEELWGEGARRGLGGDEGGDDRVGHPASRHGLCGAGDGERGGAAAAK
mmetsp:Transcript_44191/g.107837  ORF Transcript_44191/g.107837 Transcript_44191/m.107837 type:complete len:263 (+) Transcript_44191:320-1108(+)